MSSAFPRSGSGSLIAVDQGRRRQACARVEGGGWRSTSTAAAAAKVSFWRGRATGGEVIDIAARKRECALTARPSLGTNVAGLWSLRASSSAVAQLTYFLC